MLDVGIIVFNLNTDSLGRTGAEFLTSAWNQQQYQGE